MSTSTSRRSPSSVHPTRQQLDDLDALLKRMLDLPVNRLEDESDDDEDAAPPPAEKEARPAAAATAPEPMRGPHRPAFAQSSQSEAAAPPSFQYNTPHPNEADLKPRVIIVAPNAPENETNSAAEAAAYSPPQPAPERQTGGRPEDWVPLTSSWRPSSRTWKPLTEAWQQAQGERGEEEKRGRGEEENRNSSAVEPMVQSQEAVDSPLPLFFSSSPLPLVPLSSQESTAVPIPTSPAAPEWTPWYLWPFVGFNAAFDLCLWPWGPIGRWLRGPTGRALLGILGLLCLTAAAALAVADWIGWTS
jgi:hypothetical protein